MPPPDPNFRPCLRQTWSHLAFFHWKVDPAVVAARLPTGLEPDCFDGAAWIAIVPFRMSGIRVGPLPPIPGFRHFPELNLRTYVRHRATGRTGVTFFSLEADHGLGVSIGRWAFHLPYHDTSIVLRAEKDGTIDFRARRRDEAVRTRFTTLRYRYRPDPTKTFSATPGSLEHFLVERYSFFTPDRGGHGLHEGRVAHAPYSLCPVELPVCDADLFRWNELALPGRPPDHTLAALPVEVAAAWVRKVEV